MLSCYIVYGELAALTLQRESPPSCPRTLWFTRPRGTGRVRRRPFARPWPTQSALSLTSILHLRSKTTARKCAVYSTRRDWGEGLCGSQGFKGSGVLW